ncbi:MAG: guanylate kinase [Leptolyngbya sp. IPPAS B-1204]
MARGKLIVLTGPSGVGKGTLMRMLLRRHPELYLSISVTTRTPRPGEIHGRDYYFVSRAEFDQMVANHQLLEWAEFAGNCYGTPRQPVEDQIRQGKWVVLEIELQGHGKFSNPFPMRSASLSCPFHDGARAPLASPGFRVGRSDCASAGAGQNRSGCSQRI